ncbi:hypothetical protein WKK_00230 [Weissella koreensis KACC 15510]|uniref:hypothetical protein n=1 Tax=Weissella koreensis TaxID=165096 RepID=UPI0002175879|nr:hypothetical protein [Weissella koreensis]AEJ22922.1 hypothetical protein WKK_00230 [Weissella koreensis KACC 15510]
MKINIFDYYDGKTQRLLNSLRTAGISRNNLFVHYAGDLPENAISPFSFFMEIDHQKREGLFFDQVEVPEFYDIRHVNGSNANIENMGHVVGSVNYSKKGYRLVDTVDWYLNGDPKKIIKKDFYNISGKHYATSFFSEGKPYLTEYYKDGEAVVIENLVTHKIQLIIKERKIIFNNLTEFFIFFLEKAEINPDDIFINSLNYPLFIAKIVAVKPNTTLFWQEALGEKIPGNMESELNSPKALKQIIFNNEDHLKQAESQYVSTKVNLNYLSDIGEFTRKNTFIKKAFILTNSDRLYGLEDILNTFNELDITVAAYTNMSTKLEHLGDKYNNLHLIPSLAPKKLAAEMNKADIYLDINDGMKVDNVLKKAYRQNMIILSMDQVKSSNYKSLNFYDVRSLCNDLASIMSSENTWRSSLNKMIQQNGPSSKVSDYKQFLSIKN